MQSYRLRSLALTGIALALATLGVAGCGGGGDDPGGQAYGEVLHGLKRAALAKKTYDVTHRAKDLEEPEQAVIEAFCDFAWQIGVNREAAKLSEHAYIVSRIKTAAEVEMNSTDASAVNAAMNKLRSVINLASLNGRLTSNYKKACNR